MMSLLYILSSFPALNPFYGIAIFIVIPVVNFIAWQLCYLLFYKNNHHHNFSLRKALAAYITNHSYNLAITNILLALILCLNQAAVFYQSHTSVGVDISYYLRVNSLEYDNADAISAAGSMNSFGVSSLSIPHNNNRNRYLQEINDHIETNRRLSATSWLSLTYHRRSWGDVLSATELQSICSTEHRILKNLNCLQNGTLQSIIPSIFESGSCLQFSTNLNALFSSTANSEYLQDNVDPVNPRSAIVTSYMRSATCQSLSADEFQSRLNGFTLGDVEVVYVQADLLNAEFFDAITNAATVSVIAMVISAGILFLGLGNVICTVVTMLCIVLSLVGAAGFIPAANYGSISAFNVMSLFILVGVGATTVLLFAFAWNQYEPVTGRLTKRHMGAVIEINDNLAKQRASDGDGGVDKEREDDAAARWLSVYSPCATTSRGSNRNPAKSAGSTRPPSDNADSKQSQGSRTNKFKRPRPDGPRKVQNSPEQELARQIEGWIVQQVGELQCSRPCYA